MSAWDVYAARERPCCGRREYRPLGVIIADTFLEALDKLNGIEWELKDDESVCMQIQSKAPSVWELLRNPQI